MTPDDHQDATPAGRSDGHGRLAFLGVAAAALAAAMAVFMTPARPVAPVVASALGALVAPLAAGVGRRRTLIAVWHDAEHPDGVERRLIAVATSVDEGRRLQGEARSLAGFWQPSHGFSLQPEAVGVLDTGEWWRVLAHRCWPRLANACGSSVWFVTDADSPLLLAPGDSALGFAVSEASGRLLVLARRAESLRSSRSVRAFEVPVGRVLWPEGAADGLVAARPLDHQDGLVETL